MLILTLSEYSSNSDHGDVLQGVFPDMDAIKTYLDEQHPDDPEYPKHNLDVFGKSIKQLNPCSDAELKSDSRRREYGKFKNILRTHTSAGGLDNGYGGRYYSVWEIKAATSSQKHYDEIKQKLNQGHKQLDEFAAKLDMTDPLNQEIVESMRATLETTHFLTTPKAFLEDLQNATKTNI